MAKTDFKSVDEYIASQPEAVQGLHRREQRVGPDWLVQYHIGSQRLGYPTDP